jgi:photosynthetic reaction center H subunit
MNFAQSGIDIALVVTNTFFIFFVLLIIYLRREDRREGYPLEEDPSGRLRSSGGVLISPNPKTFRLPGGRGTLTVPNDLRDRRDIAARRTSIVPGSPLEPTGNPLIDGVGPASYAERAKVPDLTYHGEPKIVPLRVAKDFTIAEGDLDPRGLPVLGTDGKTAGTVSEIWVDRGEVTIRYLEVALLSGGPSVILPMTLARIDKRHRLVTVEAITAAQFADVPRIENPDQITFYEEERVVAYYGGGFLYATPGRAEPLL